MESNYLDDESVQKLIEAFEKGRSYDGEQPPTEEEREHFIAYWEHLAMVGALLRAMLAGHLIVNVKGGAMMAFYSNPENPVEALVDNPLADQIEDMLQDRDWGDENL